MFKIIEINYEYGFQRELCEIAYFDRAKIRCEELAIDFVISKEGLNFLKRKNLYAHFKKGYGLCKKETNCSFKITVFHKEPNGYIYSGDIKKITQFIVIKTNMPPLTQRESLFEANIYFDQVLVELMENRPVRDYHESPPYENIPLENLDAN